MTVPANDRLSSFSGDGSTTAFAFDFAVADQSELEVVLISSAGVSTVQTITTHYTVTLNGTGTVTFVTAPAATDKVRIAGITPEVQTASYTDNDKFPAAAHEGSMDTLAKGLQQLRRDVGRITKLPYGESGGVLIAAAARAGFLAAFNAVTGTLEPSTVSASVVEDLAALTSEQLADIATVADAIDAGTISDLLDQHVAATRAALVALTASNVTAGDVITALGYTASGDGGGTRYRVLAGDAASNSLTDNGGTVIENTAGTLTFVALEDSFVDPRWFGADGTGATVSGSEVLAAVATGRDVCFPAGTVMLMNGSTIVPAADGQRFFGGGQLKITSTDTDHIDAGDRYASGMRARFFDVYQKDDVEIEGLEFFWDPPSGSATGNRVYGVTTEDCSNCLVQKNRFIGATTPAFFWKNSASPKFKFNHCVGGGAGASFTGAFGIATGGDATGGVNGSVTNAEIVGNYIEGYVSEGIDINWDTQGFLVSKNILFNNVQRTDSADEEIDIGGGDNGFECTYGVVSDNYIVNTTATMLNGLIGVKANPDAAYGSKQIVIKGNVGIANNAAAVFGCRVKSGRDVTVEGNIFIEVGQGVIWENQDVINGKAFGNTVVGGAAATGYGLLIGGDTEDCECKNNSVYGTAGARIGAAAKHAAMVENKLRNSTTIGIQVDATNAKVNGNDVGGSSGRGIRFVSGAENCQCLFNTVYNSGQGGSAAGIEINGVDDMMVGFNRCYDDQGSKTQSYGLNITAASARITLAYNNFTGNSTGEINGLQHCTNGSFIVQEDEMRLRGPSPLFRIFEDDAAADNGKWRFNASAENFFLQTENDDEDTQVNAIAVTRTGTVVDQVQLLGADTYIGGTLTAVGVASFANPLRAFDGSATYASESHRTALFKSSVTNGGPDVLIIDADNNQNRAALRVLGNGGAAPCIFVGSNGNTGFGIETPGERIVVNGAIAIVDGMTAPSASGGYAKIYIDNADGDLKIVFADGTVKTIVTDT